MRRIFASTCIILMLALASAANSTSSGNSTSGTMTTTSAPATTTTSSSAKCGVPEFRASFNISSKVTVATVVQGMQHCASLFDKAICCTAEQVDSFQDKADDVLDQLADAVKERDLFFTALGDPQQALEDAITEFQDALKSATVDFSDLVTAAQSFNGTESEDYDWDTEDEDDDDDDKDDDDDDKDDDDKDDDDDDDDDKDDDEDDYDLSDISDMSEFEDEELSDALKDLDAFFSDGDGYGIDSEYLNPEVIDAFLKEFSEEFENQLHSEFAKYYGSDIADIFSSDGELNGVFDSFDAENFVALGNIINSMNQTEIAELIVLLSNFTAEDFNELSQFYGIFGKNYTGDVQASLYFIILLAGDFDGLSDGERNLTTFTKMFNQLNSSGQFGNGNITELYYLIVDEGTAGPVNNTNSTNSTNGTNNTSHSNSTSNHEEDLTEEEEDLDFTDISKVVSALSGSNVTVEELSELFVAFATIAEEPEYLLTLFALLMYEDNEDSSDYYGWSSDFDWSSEDWGNDAYWSELYGSDDLGWDSEDWSYDSEDDDGLGFSLDGDDAGTGILSILNNIEVVLAQIGDAFDNVTISFEEYQSYRATCVTELVKIQAAAWCLSCDPNATMHGYNPAKKSIVMDSDLCGRLKDSCYDYISNSSVQSLAINTNMLVVLIEAATDALNGGDGISFFTDGGFSNITQEIQPASVPPGCTSQDNCDWICTSLFDSGKVNIENLAAGGVLPSSGKSSSRLLSSSAYKSNRMLPSANTTTTTTSTSTSTTAKPTKFNPSDSEAGVTVSFAADPAGTQKKKSGMMTYGSVMAATIMVIVSMMF